VETPGSWFGQADPVGEPGGGRQAGLGRAEFPADSSAKPRTPCSIITAQSSPATAATERPSAASALAASRRRQACRRRASCRAVRPGIHHRAQTFWRQPWPSSFPRCAFATYALVLVEKIPTPNGPWMRRPVADRWVYRKCGGMWTSRRRRSKLSSAPYVQQVGSQIGDHDDGIQYRWKRCPGGSL
jgi:hypothetical protein